MDFVKMEGLGNDFVVIEGPYTPTTKEVESWCDRRRGVGADGVLVITPLDRSSVAMDYWNADGSPAEMCGNGLRCVARYAAAHGMVDSSSFTVETAVGPRHVEVKQGAVRAQLGPVAVTGNTIDLAGYRLDPMSVGNPHAVAFVDDCYAVPIAAAGALIEGDPAFPERTNVEFATVTGRDRIQVRVWERGAGETLACGSGAAATVAAALRRGFTGPKVTVVLPGGSLEVEMIGDEAWIEGPAVEVFAGSR
ncbi:MAG TPA: diaminopimelate epimerase [Acidimicrobiia bacterium]